MGINWQDLVALCIVFAAAGYLGSIAIGALTRKSSKGCGSACGKCSGTSEVTFGTPQQVVPIGSIPRPN